MKVSYRWLQEYVKTSLTPLELGDKFRMTSSELEGMEEWSEKFKDLLIGRVLSVANHPNASRLHIAMVDIGTKKPRRIVCGAPNLAEGQTVIVALPGATIHPLNGELITIDTATIRGEASEGMLCGADEIGLDLPSQGIVVLDTAITPGTPAGEALGLNDTVLDLEITPNRPDLLSYIGLAREVAAFDKKRLLEPPIASSEGHDTQNKIRFSVEVEDIGACPRYTVVCLENITISPSPFWLQSRLLLSGIRPINNVVDITNYCLLEYGQPLHAFDLAQLQGGGVRVRSALREESIVTLDGTSRKLEPGDIMIVDAANQPLAIAGIMGGQHSGVGETTTQILIESATFNGPQIRRTSRRLGLRSEASHRFEKGLDTEITITALKRAIYLFQEICGAKVCSEVIDHYPAKSRLERPRIHLSFTRIQEIAGVHISALESKGILQRLGFQIPALTKSSFEAIPPSWRRDVSLPEDIVEELIRIWGFERLPSTLPTGAVKAPQPNDIFRKKQLIRRSLVARGLHECVHLVFASKSELERLDLKVNQAIPLQNPLSREAEFLSPSHAIALLGNLSTANLQEAVISLFEIGHIFTQPRQETEMLSFVLRDNATPETLYRSAKAILNRVGVELQIGALEYVPADSLPFFEPKSSLQIVAANKVVGTLGIVNPKIVSKLKIRSGRTILYGELNLDELLTLPAQPLPYLAPAQYPVIERDITAIVADTLPVGDISTLINKNQALILAGWSIQNIFSGKPLESGTKSVTIHFTYNSPDRTLEDVEVNVDQQTLIKTLRTSLNARISD